MGDDGLFFMTGLLGAIANGPSNCGNRRDGRICTAQAGECRHNNKYYSPGMHDGKSWSMPFADETCPARCAYLQENERDMGTRDERTERTADIIDAMAEHKEKQRQEATLFLAMLGLDPRQNFD